MKRSLLVALFGACTAYAASSFAGANNYYAYALPQADRLSLLDAMQAAEMKVN